MFYTFGELTIYACSTVEKTAAGILKKAIFERSGNMPAYSENKNNADIVLSENNGISDKDEYELVFTDGKLTVSANGIRGLIFGIGHFLKKCVYENGSVCLTSDISGFYSPDKKIRGHQLGYRPLNNTYEAWDIEQYRRYYIELMFFGVNTVEHIPWAKNDNSRTDIMHYEGNELFTLACNAAGEYDLDVSVWYPNGKAGADMEKELSDRAEIYSSVSRFDQLFVPGGDPGELDPEELFSRLKKYKKLLKDIHPETVLYPSAQAPHGRPDWGDGFIAELTKAGDFVDGIITGPNRAFDIDTLRRKAPAEFPIRFYPDITHNVRCEHPVHFERDDWHYALAATQSRECPNPRPSEYKLLRKLISPYIIGSVSYSEGVNDDINKIVWSALDLDPDTPLNEILEDYSRLYFPGADPKKAAEGIFALEKNWEGAPDENPMIEHTLDIWERLLSDTAALADNWRFMLCLFRAECDAFVQRKMLFENRLIKQAKTLISRNRLQQAKDVLCKPFPQDITDLRNAITDNAHKLYSLIGIQLGTKDLHAQNWERGAVLDTIDQPITDRPWLLYCLSKTEKMTSEDAESFMLRAVNRNKVDKDEYYYSVALDGFIPLGIPQTPDFYMDFRGDNPNANNGTMPVCVQKFFDHFVFRAKTGGLTSTLGYKLTVTYKNKINENVKHHKVCINEKVIYEGGQFGGVTEEKFTEEMLPEGYIAISYDIPDGVLENGCAYLEITEPTEGFEIAEFRYTKKGEKADE